MAGNVYFACPLKHKIRIPVENCQVKVQEITAERVNVDLLLQEIIEKKVNVDLFL